MRRHPYRYRYLLLGSSIVAIFGLIAIGYLTGTSSIDLSRGGLADWPQYGRDQQGTRYAPLDQINRDNVAYLEMAWEYHTGDFSDGSDGRPKTTFQATPILVDGVLYLATVYGRVIALNPETGAEIWRMQGGFLQEILLLQENQHHWRIIRALGACRWDEECYDYHRNTPDASEPDAGAAWQCWKRARRMGPDREVIDEAARGWFPQAQRADCPLSD